MIAPSLRKPWFYECSHFLKNTWMALESSKSEIFQKWPKLVLGYVSRSLAYKFEQKSPKGSVTTVKHNLPIGMLLGGLRVNLNHLKMALSLQKHILGLNFQLPTCPKFISMVFQVSMEMENLHRLLWKNGSSSAKHILDWKRVRNETYL